MDRKVKLGVIGAGRMGKIHIQNLCRRIPNAEIGGIAEKQAIVPKAKQWAKQFGLRNIVADASILMDDPTIDAIVICSSSDTHADLIIQAAAAGKDIFCEKPIANELSKALEACQAIEKSGVRLQLGFNRRFDPNFQKIKRLIEEDQLGKIQIVKITSRDPELPPLDFVLRSGGIFSDMTIHDFDMIRHLTGAEVEEVYAVGSVLIDPALGEAGDFDTTVVVLKLANGANGIIDNSRQAVYGYDQRLEVFGSKGNAIAYNNRPTNVELSTERGVIADLPLYFFVERYMESFQRELEEFVAMICNGNQPTVTARDGLCSLLIALAAEKSARENRAVKINEIG